MAYEISESEEQKILVSWLQSIGVKFTSIPNSTFTKSWRQKLHNKRMGLNAGLPDLVIVLPAKQAVVPLEYEEKHRLLFIELKRAKKSLSRISKHQKSWIEALNDCQGVEAIVCFGAQQAITEIQKRL